MKEFKVQYLLAEQLNNFRENILYTNQDIKYWRNFNKERNNFIYKLL